MLNTFAPSSGFTRYSSFTQNPAAMHYFTSVHAHIKVVSDYTLKLEYWSLALCVEKKSIICVHFHLSSNAGMHPETHKCTHNCSMWAASTALWNILHPTCLYNSLSSSSSWSLITLSSTAKEMQLSPSLIEISLAGALCTRAWFLHTRSMKAAHHCDDNRPQQIPSLVKILCC